MKEAIHKVNNSKLNDLELVTLEEDPTAVGKTPHNIRDYMQRDRIGEYNSKGKLIKRAKNGEFRVSLKEVRIFLFLVRQGIDKHPRPGLHPDLDFHNVPEYHRTTHVYRLHPFLGKVIPQLVEWVLSVYFRPNDIMLDPFIGSGTTLVQGNEQQMHTTGIDEKHINQLFGTTVEYFIKNIHRDTRPKLHLFPGLLRMSKLTASLVTSAALSNTAKDFA